MKSEYLICRIEEYLNKNFLIDKRTKEKMAANVSQQAEKNSNLIDKAQKTSNRV